MVIKRIIRTRNIKLKKKYEYFHTNSSMFKLRNYSLREMEKLILGKTRREKH